MTNYGRELRMGVNIKRKENRKSNGVAEKDEESAGRSRDSIKKGIGGDEAISR